MKRNLLFALSLVFFLTGFTYAQLMTIDGERDAWYDGLNNPSDGHIQIPIEAFTNGPQPDNALDLSSRIWMAWDEDYLYFYEERKDDILAVSNAANWQNDGVELKIDSDPSLAEGGVDNVRLTVFDTDLATDAAGVDNLNAEGSLDSLSGADWVPESGVDYARVYPADGEGVNMEFRVPWEMINTNGPIDPVVGTSFGLGINVADNDGTERNHQIIWAAVVSDNIWNTPNFHGTMELLADNKVSFIAANSRVDSVNANADAWYTDPLTASTPLDITIDAERDAFYDGLNLPTDGHIQIPIEAFTNGPQPDNALDLSTRIWMAWDEDYLYFYEERKDDILSVSNAANWQNDGVELKFDSDPSMPQPGSDPVDNARLTVFDTDLATETAGVDNLNADGNLDSLSGADWVPTADDYARSYPLDGEGVNLEFRLPWEVINTNGPIDPVVGTTFGLGINIADNDGTERNHQLIWAAVVSDNIWNTPNFHGTMELLADNKVSFIAANSRVDSVNANADAWYTDPLTTSIDIKRTARIADRYQLMQNYPNPFNPSTKIEYSLLKGEVVTLAVYDVNGRLVNELVSNQYQNAGTYQLVWDGTTAFGTKVVSGVYFYRLSSQSFVESRKMILLK